MHAGSGSGAPPDVLTREIARMTTQDEARHVAFGLAHLERHVGRDPSLRERLAAAIPPQPRSSTRLDRTR